MRSVARFSLIAVPLLLAAERLRLRTHTTADGLIDQTSRPLFVSKRGHSWVSSGPDLARFDGRPFRIYSSADGWTGRRRLSIIETSSGEFPGGAGLEPVPLPGRDHELEFLFEDSQRRVRASPVDGGYRRDGTEWRALTEFRLAERHHQRRVGKVAEDSAGDIWVATYSGIYRFRGDGAGSCWASVTKP